MRISTQVALALMVTIGGTAPSASSSPPAGQDGSGLARQAGRFALTEVNPEADLSRYCKLRPSSVNLKFRSRSRQSHRARAGTLIRERTTERAVMDSEDLEKLGQVIDDALVSELGLSDTFELVDETDRDTLLLRSAVVDIVSKKPSRAARKKGIDAPLLVEGTLVFELVDAETGVIAARLGERRTIEQVDVDAADPATPWEAVGEWARHAGADLRMELERFCNGPG